MRTLEEMGDKVDCFLFGHDWAFESRTVKRCLRCGERRAA